MKFILGTKEEMTEYFTEEGKVVPVTIVRTSPNVVTQVRTVEKDGYNALQVGFGTKNAKNINKPEKGHLKDTGNFQVLREFRLDSAASANVGDAIDPFEIFTPGTKVVVSGISKGKGFQGVVKRHGFKGGPRTHGQKHSEREPGSIGGGLRTHVPKGMRMAGRMGSDRITQKNIEIVALDKENNVMLIKGALPGRRGTLLEIIAK